MPASFFSQSPAFPNRLRSFCLWLLVCVLCAFGAPSAWAQPTVAPTVNFPVANHNSATLSWSAVSGATIYDIYQSTSAGTTGTVVNNSTTTSKLCTGLTDGTTYYFQVCARNSSGSGPLSTQVSVTPVAPPTMNSVLVGNNSVTLNWNAVVTPNLSYYEVLRGVYGSSDPLVLVGTTTDTTYTDTSVTNGTAYVYRLRVANPDPNPNLFLNSILAKPAVTPTISALAGNHEVTISFAAMPEAQQYQLWVSTVAGELGTYSAASNTPVFNITAYNSQQLVNGTTYYFTLRPYTGWGTPANSNQVVCTPINGPVLSTPVLGDNSVGLKWTPIALNPETAGTSVYYEIYRTALSSSTYPGTPIATTSATTYTDATAVNNTAYKYKIRAANPDPNPYLESGNVGATPIGVPGLNTPVAGAGQVSLSWTAVDGATSYLVYKSTNPDDLGVLVSNINALTVNCTGLTNGTTYYFRVQAHNGTGSGALSVQKSAMPLAVPIAVSPVTPTPGNTQIQLSFPSVANATEYRIYRATTSNGYNYTTPTLTATGTGTVTATDTGLTNGTTYYYVVRAANASGASASSNQVSAVPAVGSTIDPPSTPGLPEVVSVSSSGAVLKTPALPAHTTSLALQRAKVVLNNLQPVTSGLKVWLDASQLSGANGTSLNLWPDRSGNRNNATQAVIKSQPKLITNSLNGHPVVRLDGAEDGVGDFFNLPSQTQIRTAIVVAKHKTGSQTWAPILGSKVNNFHGGEGTSLFHPVYTPALTIGGQAYVNGVSTNPVDILKPTQFQVLTFATTAPAQVDFISTQEGYEFDRSWNGDFAEVMLYDHVLTTQERQDTEAYLVNKYKLKDTSLPASPAWETVATGLGALANRTETGLTSDTDYFYRCVAVGAGGQANGDAVLVKTGAVAPTTPGSPTLVSATATTVTLHLPAMPANTYSLQIEYRIHGEDDNGYMVGAASNIGGIDVTLQQLNPATQYDFRTVATGNGGRAVSLPLVASTASRGSGTGLTGAYYTTLNFENTPSRVRVDPTINFNWLDGSPVPGVIPFDNYSVRWRGQIEPLYSERYKFRVSGDDAFRLRINGTTLFDVWYWGGYGEHEGEITLEKGKKYEIVLDYADRGGNAYGKFEWESASQKREVVPQEVLYPLPVSSGTGLTAEYFDDSDLSDFFMKRVDPEVNFQWWSDAPTIGMGRDSFSTRWSGKIQPLYSETYTFTLDADNEARLWINNQLITTATSGLNTGTVALTAGQKYDIKIEYKEVDGDAHASLLWESPTQTKEVVPASCLFPTTVTMPSPSNGNGLRGRYFKNTTLASGDLMMNRVDNQLDFNWHSGTPSTDLQPHNFSVRWTGKVKPLFTEKYQFIVDTRDRCRVWVDGTLLIDRWNTDVLSEPYGDVDGSINLVAGQQYDLKVEYIDVNNGDGQARIKLLWTSPSQFLEAIPQTQLFAEADSAAALGSGTGLLASYFMNQRKIHVEWTYLPDRAAPCNYNSAWVLDEFPNQFAKKVDSYVVPTINFDWGGNTPWGGGDDFTARWQGEIQPLYSETYTFKTETDDGVRLWVNGQQLINDWTIGGARNHQDTITLVAGQKYSIVMEMFDARNGQTGSSADSKAKLYWSSPSQALEIVPQRQLYPAAPQSTGYGNGLRGHYYSNADHTDLVGDRIDSNIDFDWSTTTPYSLDRNTFAVRWTGYIDSGYDEYYRFSANTDDRVKVWIGGQPVIDNEKNPAAKFGTVRMISGVKTPIVVEFVQSTGEAHLNLEWESQHQEKEIVPMAHLYSAMEPQLQDVYSSCADISECSTCPGLPDIYDGYAAKIDVPSKVKAGETFTVKVWFKNTGQKPWVPGFGTGQVFGLSDQGFLWGQEGAINDPRAQTLYLQTAYVAPGDVGEFTGTMHAPVTTGTYDASWAILVGGGRFIWSPNLRIQVLPAAGESLAAPRVLKTSTTTTTLKIPQLLTHSDGVELQRFKQSAPDAPVTSGLKLWLKADNLTAAKAGEPLAQWNDASGAAQNATQTVAASRPLKINGAINGRPTVRFDGKDDFFDFPVINDIHSVYIVLKDRETNKNAGTMLGNRYPVLENFMAGGTTNIFTGWNGPSLTGGTGAINSYSTLPLDMKKSADYQLVSVDLAGAASADLLGFGVYSNIKPWDGDIAEVLIYNSVLGATDKRSVEAYLTAKYGCPTAYEPETGATWMTIGPVLSGGEEYVDTGLDPNSTYWYRCVPVEAGADPGKSAHTTTLSDTTIPDAPDEPTFTEVGATSVKVHAPELPAYAENLTLQMKEEAAPVEAYVDVDQVIVPEAPVVVDKLAPLTEYAFRYVASNAKGETIGGEASVTTLEPAPDAPDAPSIENVGQFDATLKMPALPLRADSLQLQMKAPGAADYVTVDEDIDAGETYHATSLLQAQPYLFRCVAVNEAGSTPGLVAGITTDLPLPGAPMRPKFSSLTDTTVDVTAPALPSYAASLTLQYKSSAAPTTAYMTIAQGLAANSLWSCTNLQPGMALDFRYLAVNSSGSVAGEVGSIQMLVPQVTWSAGTSIDCLGIRFPEVGQSVTGGTVVDLDSYLATDFDLRQIVAGTFSQVTNHSDTCSYSWTVSGGSFVDSVSVGQKVQWIAPTTPGTYTIGLTVDDQAGANKKTTEGGSRNDDSTGYNDAPLKYQVTINVLP